MNFLNRLNLIFTVVGMVGLFYFTIWMTLKICYSLGLYFWNFISLYINEEI